MNYATIPPNRRILLIDDNESIHQDFRKILNPAAPGKAALANAAAELFGEADAGPQRTEGYEIDSAFQGQEGLEKVRLACAEGRPYAMAFVDVRMPPGWDGIETISRIWREYQDLQVVICTAYSDYSLDKIVARLGRTDRLLILKKPFDAIEVLQFADALTDKWRLSQEARAKMDDLETLVAERTRELRDGQKQLIEARKMELVGKLAGGIAHDFNSLLTAIIGHADLIQQVVPADELPYQSAVEIGKSASNAAKLTHQLLAFSRKQMLKPERLDIHEAIRAMEPKLRQVLGDGVEFRIKPNAHNSIAKADGSQFQQVLISLAHNARDAMAEGGVVTLATADATLDAIDGPSTEEYVTVSMTDSGSGISEEAKQHLFEPYFTTKAPGIRKGLGLAMCHGILKQSGGHISFESEVGRGSSFKVYLPRFRDEGVETRPAAVPATGTVPTEKGTEVILLVEEKAALRAVATTVLETQGYTVRCAASCQEAMSVAGKSDRVDLLVADAEMAEMTGNELAEWLCSSRPAMKVLLTSPFKDGAGFLHKPYTPTLLTEKVRAILDGGEAAETKELCGSAT